MSLIVQQEEAPWVFVHCPKTTERKFSFGVLNLYEAHLIALISVNTPTPYQILYYTAFKVQDILSIREYYNLLVKKILLPVPIHHKICLYMSNHISLVYVWVNFMPPLFSCCETVFTIYLN